MQHKAHLTQYKIHKSRLANIILDTAQKSSSDPKLDLKWTHL